MMPMRPHPPIQGAQKLASSHHIIEVRFAMPLVVEVKKRFTVSTGATVINTEHRIAMIKKILNFGPISLAAPPTRPTMNRSEEARRCRHQTSGR